MLKFLDRHCFVMMCTGKLRGEGNLCSFFSFFNFVLSVVAVVSFC